MSNYTRSHDFSVKDALPNNDPEKIITGSDVDDEFDAIVTAVATKQDAVVGATEGNVATLASTGLVQDGGTALADLAKLASPALTGVPTAPTAAAGTDTTQIATTAFANAASAVRDVVFVASNTNTAGSGSAADLASITLPDVQAGSSVIIFATLSVQNTVATSNVVQMDITDNSNTSILSGGEKVETWTNASFTSRCTFTAMAIDTSPGTGSVTFKVRHNGLQAAQDDYTINNYAIIALEVA